MSSMQQILGSNPLAQSLQRSGIPLSVLAQQTPSSANFQPDMQVPPQTPVPEPDKNPMAAAGSMSQAPTPAPQSAPQPQAAPNPLAQETASRYNNEAQQIIEALTDRLNAVTKAEMKHGKQGLSSKIIPEAKKLETLGDEVKKNPLAENRMAHLLNIHEPK